ncbi:hypothetical protein [Glutamicibacter sp. V16R2B1]|uniref:hypothetical protein n=1 Tax=Glutamicibacter sp. V16R2B1 TaxID=2036207 RepID=UPI0010FED435|nr:hypothetical protein [Glutamicibacter sp. V16R2B1]TLK52815.1 hypothetical protein FDN03_08255 [Glutamicibacter sp. V16R2B1]
MQQFDVLVLTALLTIVALGIISAVLVVSYRRTHATEIREDLLAKAQQLGLRVDPAVSNDELRAQVKRARHEARSGKPKAA